MTTQTYEYMKEYLCGAHKPLLPDDTLVQILCKGYDEWGEPLRLGDTKHWGDYGHTNCPAMFRIVDGRYNKPTPSVQPVDNVNQPEHYKGNGLECIDAIEAQMTPEEFLGYLRGNVAKYLWRWRHKGGVESLRKAQWYLNRLAEAAERKERSHGL